MEPDNIGDNLLDENVRSYLNENEEKYAKGLKGEYRANAQYWITYVRLVDMLQNLHEAI